MCDVRMRRSPETRNYVNDKWTQETLKGVMQSAMKPWVIELLSSPDEINAVLVVEEASFTNPWSREMYIAEIENKGISFCFVAKDEHGRVAGFCSFWHVLDELHINNLAVLPEFRRAGIA